MIDLLLWWLLIVVATLFITSRRGRLSPMLLAYVASLSALHVPGVINYLGPADTIDGEFETRLGFEATLVALALVLVGALLARTPIKQLAFDADKAARRRLRLAGTSARLDNGALGVLMLAIGVFAYFVALPIAERIPSLTALIAPMGSLLIIGLWLLVWDAAVRRDRKRLALILLALPLLPASTLLLGGFLGYGVAWMLCILAVVYCLWPRRALFVLAAPWLAYLGLSIGAAYFLERKEIREAVWGDAPFAERIERAGQIFRRFELYSVSNPEQVEAIDERLNQNKLVGAGILSHEDGYVALHYGSTVPWWVFIPRVVWPDKPQIGGGLDLVANFTGLYFADGTSVGTGQVLEFYMNFGYAGILIGSLAWGFVLARLDRRLVEGFRNQDLPEILFAGLVGMALLQPGGNLKEILVSVVGALFVAKIVGDAAMRYVRTHSRRFVATEPGQRAGSWFPAHRVR